MIGLTARNGPDNNERLFPRCDCLRQWSVSRLMGQILLAGKEAQECTPLVRDLVADGPPQHWIAGLKRVKNGALRGRTLDVKFYLAVNLRQGSEMVGEDYPDHARLVILS